MSSFLLDLMSTYDPHFYFGGILPALAILGAAGIGGAVDMMNQSSANNAARGNQLEAQRFQDQLSRDTLERSGKEWDRQFDKSAEFANSAYQRQMADMSKAGLNPILAGMGGGGAPMPSGGSGSTSTGGAGIAQAGAAKVSGALQSGVSSAIDKARLDRETKLTDSNVELNKAISEKTYADKTLSLNSARNKAVEGQILDAELGAAQSEARLRSRRAIDQEKWYDYDAGVARGRAGLGLVDDVKGLIIPKVQWRRGYSERDMLDAAKGKGVLK